MRKNDVHSVLFLLSEHWVELQEGSDEEGDHAACHDDDEEDLIAYGIFDISREHAWEHETEVGDSGADGIVRGLVFPLTVVEHVESEDGESESVSKLLYE